MEPSTHSFFFLKKIIFGLGDLCVMKQAMRDVYALHVSSLLHVILSPYLLRSHS